MFGIGGSEIIVILIVALLFLGPDKMPDAARQISKGIRQLKRGSREIQQTIENDETIGGAIRDLKSALRGEDPVPRKKKPRPVPKAIEMEADEPPDDEHDLIAAPAPAAVPDAQLELELPPPAIKLPRDAGEIDPDLHEGANDRAEMAALIRPATGTVAKGEVVAEPAAAEPAAVSEAASEPKHG